MDFLLHPANWDLTDPSSIPYLFLDHLYITGLTLLISLLIAFPSPSCSCAIPGSTCRCRLPQASYTRSRASPFWRT